MFKTAFIATCVAASFGIANNASAATLYDCGNKDNIDYTVTLADQSTAICVTANLNESSGMVEFDGMDFALGIRDQDGGSVPAPGSPLSWSTDPYENDAVADEVHDWGIALADTWIGKVLLELKQGNSYALFDVTESCDFDLNSCSGTWTVSKDDKQTNDLSHTRAWYKTGELPPVPLPAAGWLLLAGVAGLGAWGRRRKSV